MRKEDIIAKVKTLQLPDQTFIVFGSAPLAIAGLREAHDIDLLVSKEVFESLKRKGWHELDKGPNDRPLVHDVFEAHAAWNFSSYNPTLEYLLASATVIGGIPFASLKEVRKWKMASGRPKDIADLTLMDGMNV